MNKVKVGKKIIGDGKPVYVIAEIGGNFSTFEDAKIIQCDFSNSKFHSVDLKNTIFTQCDFTNCKYFSETKNISDAYFLECDFLDVDMSWVNEDIRNAIFIDCKNISF